MFNEWSFCCLATDSSLVNLQWSVHPWNRFHGWTFHQQFKKYEKKTVFVFPWVEKKVLSSCPTNETVFWKDKFDVFTKGLASSRTRFRRRWSFLVTKRLLKDEKGLVCFFVTMSLFFWKTFPSHLQLILSTEKKMYSQLNVALKKGRENDSERKQNHFQQSQVVF